MRVRGTWNQRQDKGQRYLDRGKGIDVVIGSSVEAKNALLAQYGSWKLIEEDLKCQILRLNQLYDNANDLLLKTNNELDNALEKLKEIIRSGFLTRLKWLFRGVKI